MKIKNFLTIKIIREYRKTLREKGVKGFIKTYGWKVVFGVFMFYLIRDSILYILIPYMIAKGIFN